MMIIGIDPGKTGAIAIELAGKIKVYDIPDCRQIAGIRNLIWIFDNIRRMRQTAGDCTFIIESVHSMPREGVVSSFNFGFNYGVLNACVAYASEFDYQVIYVSPMEWKKILNLSRDKKKSLELARKNHPEIGNQLNRKKDHNRAEAVLLIDYFHKLKGEFNGKKQQRA